MSVKNHLRDLFLVAVAAYGFSLQLHGGLFQPHEIRAEAGACQAKLAADTPCSLSEQRALGTMEKAGYKDLKGLYLIVAAAGFRAATRKKSRTAEQPAPSAA